VRAPDVRAPRALICGLCRGLAIGALILLLVEPGAAAPGSDGRDVTLHAGTAAEFGDDGLFYPYQSGGGWPGRISFVPFARLPLH
jgi:hypothetical protein